MVRDAAARATPSDIDRLAALLAAQRAALGTASRFITADMAFHTAIAAVSGNPIFEATSEAMLKWLKHYHTAVLLWSGNETTTLSEHEVILEAIAAHDPDAAEHAMVAHLDRSAALYVHSS